MSQIITDNCTYQYPYTKPTENDNGDVFGELIETFMERMAAHTHDGDYSNLISLNIDKHKRILDANTADWSSDAEEMCYVRTINDGASGGDPSGATSTSNHFRRYYIGVDDPTTPIWEEFFPKIVWVDATSYKLYCNINDKAIKIFTI